MSIDISVIQVRNIACLFKVDPSTVYLVDDIDSAVLFPLESGKFKTSKIIPGATYEVHGNSVTASTSACTSTSSSHSLQPCVSSPFGSYTNPSFQGDMPPPHPPRSKFNKIKKSILVVSLSKKGKEKKGKIEYTAVTQVVVSLSLADCNVATVTDRVTQQVGFQAVVLDSKCYPLMSNEATTGVEFWKSTRKILAASKSVFRKLTDRNTDNVSVIIEQDSGGPPQKKRRIEVPKPDLVDSHQELKLILEKLSKIESQLGFLGELSHSLDCSICKSVALKPVVSPCCQRVIGCEVCVSKWLNTNTRCPLCRASDTVGSRFPLKGFDHAITLMKAVNAEKAETPSETAAETNSDSDFEDLPPFSSH